MKIVLRENFLHENLLGGKRRITVVCITAMMIHGLLMLTRLKALQVVRYMVKTRLIPCFVLLYKEALDKGECEEFEMVLQHKSKLHV